MWFSWSISWLYFQQYLNRCTYVLFNFFSYPINKYAALWRAGLLGNIRSSCSHFAGDRWHEIIKKILWDSNFSDFCLTGIFIAIKYPQANWILFFLLGAIITLYHLYIRLVAFTTSFSLPPFIFIKVRVLKIQNEGFIIFYFLTSSRNQTFWHIYYNFIEALIIIALQFVDICYYTINQLISKYKKSHIFFHIKTFGQYYNIMYICKYYVIIPSLLWMNCSSYIQKMTDKNVMKHLELPMLTSYPMR